MYFLFLKIFAKVRVPIRMKKPNKILIQNGLIVTMNKLRDVFRGDLLIEGSQIKKIEKKISPPKDCKKIDATHHFVIPGLIQAHIHLCQTLFRGDADDLALLDWLKKRIWPFEHAHTPKSLGASARLGLLELQLNGTTAIMDMGTVQHTDYLFEAAQESRIRYWGGKCLMDLKGSSGPLYEPFNKSVKETETLVKTWHRKTERLNYAMCPRFSISCSDQMMEYSRAMQSSFHLLLHTHASENRDEVKILLQRTGLRNMDYFYEMGLLNERSVIAHGIHLSDQEIARIVKSKATIVHCPSSNLKLGSGTAKIHEYLKKKMRIALGADGAACNNGLDPFIEMRLAALLQKPLFGPQALSAKQAFELATLGGARALNMEKQIGSLETGKLADVVLVKRDHPSVATIENPYSALVYSCLGRDVDHVFIHGDHVVKNRVHQYLERESVLDAANKEHRKLLERVL